MSALDLTKEEQTNVRTALRFLRSRLGGWAAVAKSLHFNENTISNVVASHKPVSPTLAFRIAKLVKVGVDDVLTGRYPAPGTCPHCGHRPEEGS